MVKPGSSDADTVADPHPQYCMKKCLAPAT